MMSFQDYRAFSKYRKEESISLFVETLTGTTFEMSVYPHDTILSVKAKIQRIGGIPIGQQHLLYNFQELDDSSLLIDYSITSGSTIKLVLSMRGGPISTVRRVLPLDDAALKELMDCNREELLDDLPPGCKMAVLVFRDGDHLNMFRVLENVDGSYSPLSDSPMLNLFEDEAKLKTEEFTKRLEENTVTMEKMYDLKTKLAELAIQRNTHKLMPVESTVNKTKSATIPATSADRNRNAIRSAVHSLPPIIAEPREEVPASLARKTRTTEFSRVPVLPEIASRAPPSSRVAVLDSELCAERAIECVQGLDRERPKTSPDDDRLTGERVCQILTDASRLSRSRRCSALPVHRFPCVPPMANTSLDSDQFTSHLLNDQSRKEKDNVSSVSCLLSVIRRPKSGLVRENTRSAGNVKNFLTSVKYSRRINDESSAPDSSKLSEALVNETELESSNDYYSSSPRLLSGVLNSPSNSPFKLREITSRSKESLSPISFKTNKSADHSSITGGNTAALNTRSRLFSRQADGDNCRSNVFPSSKPTSSELLTYPDESSFSFVDDCSFTDSIQRNTFTITSKVPTVKSSQNINLYESRVKKKKKEPKTRCTVCRKKLTIISTYTCRCDKIFCSTHRYSEAHDCSFDYKEEGRRILEHNNPLITAPKLPKI